MYCMFHSRLLARVHASQHYPMISRLKINTAGNINQEAAASRQQLAGSSSQAAARRQQLVGSSQQLAADSQQLSTISQQAASGSTQASHLCDAWQLNATQRRGCSNYIQMFCCARSFMFELLLYVMVARGCWPRC